MQVWGPVAPCQCNLRGMWPPDTKSQAALVYEPLGKLFSHLCAICKVGYIQPIGIVWLLHSRLESSQVIGAISTQIKEAVPRRWNMPDVNDLSASSLMRDVNSPEGTWETGNGECQLCHPDLARLFLGARKFTVYYISAVENCVVPSMRDT